MNSVEAFNSEISRLEEELLILEGGHTEAVEVGKSYSEMDMDFVKKELAAKVEDKKKSDLMLSETLAEAAKAEEETSLLSAARDKLEAQMQEDREFIASKEKYFEQRKGDIKQTEIDLGMMNKQVVAKQTELNRVKSDLDERIAVESRQLKNATDQLSHSQSELKAKQTALEATKKILEEKTELLEIVTVVQQLNEEKEKVELVWEGKKRDRDNLMERDDACAATIIDACEQIPDLNFIKDDVEAGAEKIRKQLALRSRALAADLTNFVEEKKLLKRKWEEMKDEEIEARELLKANEKEEEEGRAQKRFAKEASKSQPPSQRFKPAAKLAVAKLAVAKPAAAKLAVAKPAPEPAGEPVDDTVAKPSFKSAVKSASKKQSIPGSKSPPDVSSIASPRSSPPPILQAPQAPQPVSDNDDDLEDRYEFNFAGTIPSEKGASASKSRVPSGKKTAAKLAGKKKVAAKKPRARQPVEKPPVEVVIPKVTVQPKAAVPPKVTFDLPDQSTLGSDLQEQVREPAQVAGAAAAAAAAKKDEPREDRGEKKRKVQLPSSFVTPLEEPESPKKPQAKAAHKPSLKPAPAPKPAWSKTAKKTQLTMSASKSLIAKNKRHKIARKEVDEGTQQQSQTPFEDSMDDYGFSFGAK
jgi:hypothetical protein